jgi:16S rRNA (guanine527-N7)-methyltransferase
MDVADRSPLPRRPLPRSLDETPPLDAQFSAVIDDGLRSIGIALDPEQRAAIEAHVRLLLAWNESINLSGLRDPVAIARGHVLDALLAVPALREITRGHETSLMDIGSGGGFPGLPLAIALPAQRAALVDSIAKKAAFLEAAAELTGGNVQALAERAEDLADEPDHREAWDLVVARAVGSVAECAELGLPLARRGGHVVIWKRASDAPARAALHDDVSRARRIIQAVGGTAARVVELAHGDDVGLGGSCVVVIRKVRLTPDRYPRSVGDRRRRTLP